MNSVAAMVVLRALALNARPRRPGKREVGLRRVDEHLDAGAVVARKVGCYNAHVTRVLDVTEHKLLEVVWISFVIFRQKQVNVCVCPERTSRLGNQADAIYQQQCV